VHPAPHMSHDRPLIISSAESDWQCRARLRELWTSRELLRMMLARDLAIRYHHTAIGLGWVLMQPLLLAGVFSLVIARMPGHEALGTRHLILIGLCGIIPWTMIGRAVGEGGRALSNQAHIVSKVYFPREIIPLACTLTAVIDMLVILALTIIIACWLGLVAPCAWWCIPASLAIATTSGVGFALGLAGFDARYKDVRYTLPFLAQLLFLVSPIVYPLASLGLPAWANSCMLLNPIAAAAELMRAGLAGGVYQSPVIALSGIVMAGLQVLVASVCFHRQTRDIGDVL